MPRKRNSHNPYKLGRIAQTWPPIPVIPTETIEHLEAWLRARRGARRPLTVTAPFLCIVCALHEKGFPLPTRARLADAIGTTSKDSIDAAISASVSEGDIEEEYMTVAGTISPRPSIIRQRYIKPSRELVLAYRAAKRATPIAMQRA